jgi:uncharacterized membrane protein
MPLAMTRPRGLSLAIALLAMLGAGISVVSLVSHYSSSPSEYCDFDETFNCDLVNRSVYSSFLGVPVALIGIVGYALLLGLSLACSRMASALLLAGALAGLAFALYLTYIEAFILAVWCILCLGSLAVISAITLLAALRLRQGTALQAAS